MLNLLEQLMPGQFFSSLKSLQQWRLCLPDVETFQKAISGAPRERSNLLMNVQLAKQRIAPLLPG